MNQRMNTIFQLISVSSHVSVSGKDFSICLTLSMCSGLTGFKHALIEDAFLNRSNMLSQ